jgi:GT2 family glycosyltransferase
MQLSIIVINYNTYQLTCNCIRSVKEKTEGLEYEIVLVDNASTERDANDFKKEFQDINLIANPVNSGFAGGNNLGISSAKGEYILLLNSDTELINNAPLICYDYMQANSQVGMTTAQLTYPDGRIQYNCRRFRTISWELLEILPFYKLLSKQKAEERMLHHYFDHQRMVECDWVWGAFMFFPKKILSQLPAKKLPDDFFMYSEDVLWCWEFKHLGFKIHFLPDAKVMHVHKGSSSKDKLIQIRKTSNKNHVRFMKKIYPDWRWYVFAAVFYTKQNAALWLEKLFNRS